MIDLEKLSADEIKNITPEQWEEHYLEQYQESSASTFISPCPSYQISPMQKQPGDDQQSSIVDTKGG